MRLRFREAGIKRLEAVASGKISAEAHLLKEKEEHLQEIEVLRAQVDRNQEVTRFAMENLRLKEEITRLKSFYEGGEREKMDEQIIALQNKLLEALDWKLMHKTDSSDAQKRSSGLQFDNHDDSDQLNLDKESASHKLSSIQEENEFLQMQAVQLQSEINSLRKKFDSKMEEQEKMERHIKDLETELEALRSAEETKVEKQTLPTEINKISCNDQLELEAMVDAIGAASQREAEAHEMAITLAKENEELRAKIKILVEDNSKLIELYERAVEDQNNKVSSLGAEGKVVEAQNTEIDMAPDMESTEGKHLEDLEHQLTELHDENEKLMSLYEKAMQERDDLKRELSSALDNNAMENKQSESLEIEKLMSLYEEAMQERDDLKRELSSALLNNAIENRSESPEKVVEKRDYFENPTEENQNSLANNRSTSKCPSDSDELTFQNLNEIRSVEMDELDTTFGCPGDCDEVTDTGGDARTCFDSLVKDELVLLREVLDKSREKLSMSANAVDEFRGLEEAILKCDHIAKEIETENNHIQSKQLKIESHRTLYSDLQSRRTRIDNKLAATRVTLTSIASSTTYYEQREGRAKARVDASVSFFKQKEENLARLQILSDEISAKKRVIRGTEEEIRKNLLFLKAKLEEENQRQENERVLISIDNIQRNEIPQDQSSWKLGGKATELLKSEEQKTKLQNEIKQSREKLHDITKDVEDLNVKRQKLSNQLQIAGLEMEKAAKKVTESEHALQMVISEKETLIEVKEDGKTEIDTLIAEYYECIFEECLREQELNILDEDWYAMSIKLQILKSERSETVKGATQLVCENECKTGLRSENIRQELKDVNDLIQEACDSVSRIVT